MDRIAHCIPLQPFCCDVQFHWAWPISKLIPHELENSKKKKLGYKNHFFRTSNKWEVLLIKALPELLVVVLHFEPTFFFQTLDDSEEVISYFPFPEVMKNVRSQWVNSMKRLKKLIFFQLFIHYSPVLRIRIHMFLGLPNPDPDPLVRGMAPDPDPSIMMQK